MFKSISTLKNVIVSFKCMKGQRCLCGIPGLERSESLSWLRLTQHFVGFPLVQVKAAQRTQLELQSLLLKAR